MYDDDDNRRLRPEEYYALHGVYDLEAYDRDLAEFPESFDALGWPLFGDYDPYALQHPITGLPWQKAPRIPRDDETDRSYEFWFEIARRFELAFSSGILSARKVAEGIPNAPEGDGENYYRVQSDKALKGNLAYLARYVLPRLGELIEQRVAGPELTVLWGEFTQLTATLPLSSEAAELRQRRGDKDDRSAQLKWYLHWRRRHCEELRKTAQQANLEFVNTAWDAYSGKLTCPEGFTDKWFAGAVGRTEKDGKMVPCRGLPDAMKKAGRDRRRERLLASPAHEDPKIPPLDPTAFHPK